MSYNNFLLDEASEDLEPVQVDEEVEELQPIEIEAETVGEPVEVKQEQDEEPGTQSDVPIAVKLPFSYLWKIKGTSVVIDRDTHFVVGYHDLYYNVYTEKSSEVEAVCAKYGLIYFHPSYLPRILGTR